MADLLFDCSGCGARLAVDSKGVGQIIHCCHCQQKVLVPESGVVFCCPNCQSELAVPKGLAGSTRDCVNCGKQITVPSPTQQTSQKLQLLNPNSMPSAQSRTQAKAGKRLKCPKCQSVIAFSQEEVEKAKRKYTEFACPKCGTEVVLPDSPPPPRLCPYCGNEIAKTAILCIHCGTNLQTGRQYGRAPASTAYSDNDQTTTDIFAIVTFSSGVLSIWMYPIVFVPICFFASLISYYRLKENSNLKGRGLRLTGAILGVISSIWLFELRDYFGSKVPIDNSAEVTTQDATTTDAWLQAQKEKYGQDYGKSEAFSMGYCDGKFWAEGDRKYDSYNSANPEYDKKIKFAGRRGYSEGSTEYGDYWDGYDVGYWEARHK